MKNVKGKINAKTKKSEANWLSHKNGLSQRYMFSHKLNTNTIPMNQQQERHQSKHVTEHIYGLLIRSA